ncbi:phosphotransferase [Bacillus solimangrovi]|uniref:Aminoglycoside phosphotransferase domain-containing protein n=1 Tax=Bacillus solimangrovi TaxID=1305675 RepID=A0A1E5LBJ1_9BACI|nr:phosphotransferase [Bacillus solimangrovi]OEH91441.1 hypothetical protein BFG57_04825 [Bacillus solimangrovi]
MEHLQTIMDQYQVQPHYVEENGALYKLFTWGGIYALKKVKGGGQALSSLVQATQIFMKRQLRIGVPIVPTISNQLFSSDGVNYYYLTPWIEAKERSARDQLHEVFKLSAKLHQQTSKENKIEDERYEQFYDFWTNKMDDRKQLMEDFLNYCEQQIYMSPFELNYCLHANEMMKLDDIARQKLDLWHEKVAGKEKERVSLCHGALKLENLVNHHNDKSYFINFEHSYIAPAVFDLEYLVNQHVYQFPDSRKAIFTGLQAYQRIFPLAEDEKLLLSWLLLNNISITDAITDYQNQTTRNELKHVKRLQRTIGLTQNISHVVYETFDKPVMNTSKSTSQ